MAHIHNNHEAYQTTHHPVIPGTMSERNLVVAKLKPTFCSIHTAGNSTDFAESKVTKRPKARVKQALPKNLSPPGIEPGSPDFLGPCEKVLYMRCLT